MEEDAEWQLDSETQFHMDKHINYMIAEAKKLASWLNEQPGFQPGHPLFVWWKINNWYLHKLCVQIYDERNSAWRLLVEKIKIWCLTVDGFLQIISGKSYLSRHFECVKVQLVIGDEFHQLSIEKLYTISHFVCTFICYYHDAQRIVFLKYRDQLAGKPRMMIIQKR